VKPRLVHLTTTDMSLDWLLGPQLTAFQAAGYEVIGMSSPGPHVAAIEAAGVRHVAVHSLSRAPSVLQDLRAMRELRRVLRAENVDVLHTHNPKPGVLGRIVGWTLGIPVIVNTQHGLYAQPTDGRRRRWPVYVLERIGAACSDAELVQNPEDAETLIAALRVPKHKVSVLGNGVDLSRFEPENITAGMRDRLRREWGFEPDDVVCVVVGRLVAEKGLPEILQAACTLAAEASRARFVIIGPTDPDKPDALDPVLIRSAQEVGVIFTGQRSDMPECYTAGDLFVTASHREGFPRAAMEAGAMGLALVATDIRGCRQVVDDGHNGILVRVKDPDSLTAGIRSMVNDPSRRQQMMSAARPYALEHFDQQSVIDKTLATYERLRATTTRGTRRS
jgi:glycosyltransferase involved in cell wall biosynthesis